MMIYSILFSETSGEVRKFLCVVSRLEEVILATLEEVFQVLFVVVLEWLMTKENMSFATKNDEGVFLLFGGGGGQSHRSVRLPVSTNSGPNYIRTEPDGPPQCEVRNAPSFSQSVTMMN
jgi:hypothetical protein